MTVVAPGTGTRLVDRFERGLDAPICLTWELTYACNLACVHCLSSSGRRDPRELSTAECKALIDEFERMQIFYVNIGGGEPTIRSDFWELVDYATDHHVGVKFSTNGSRITEAVAVRLAASDYVDVQISLDGADRRGQRRRAGARVRSPPPSPPWSAWRPPASPASSSRWWSPGTTWASSTRFKAIADRYGAQLRLTRLRPSGRGADVWDELHPTAAQQRQLYDWLVRRGEEVLTGDSFFHLAGYGDALPGLNLCGAGRVVCLVDPVGDVYACPFAIHDEFLAGNVRASGGFTSVWRRSDLFLELRQPQSAGACGSLRPLRRLPGRLHGGEVLHRAAPRRTRPRMRPRARRARPRRPRRHRDAPTGTRPFVPPPAGGGGPHVAPPRCARSGRHTLPTPDRRPDRSCDEHPLAGYAPGPRPDRDVTSLAGTVALGGRTAPSRVVFGPHETNLGTGRAFSDRHVAYYAARAAGGAGVVVTETASVHPSDWPYERAPLASACGPGLARRALEACRPHGTVVLAGLGHAGGHGSSAYSQSVLWAPSPVADVVSREMPMAMGTTEIAALVEGFRLGRPGRRRCRSRRGGARRRAPLGPPPVPLGAHQPARRRLRAGPAGAHP